MQLGKHTWANTCWKVHIEKNNKNMEIPIGNEDSGNSRNTNLKIQFRKYIPGNTIRKIQSRSIPVDQNRNRDIHIGTYRSINSNLKIQIERIKSKIQIGND